MRIHDFEDDAVTHPSLGENLRQCLKIYGRSGHFRGVAVPLYSGIRNRRSGKDLCWCMSVHVMTFVRGHAERHCVD